MCHPINKLKSVGQFEKVHTSFSVITYLANSHPKNLVNIDDFCKECENQGISCIETKQILLKLKEKGEIVLMKSDVIIYS